MNLREWALPVYTILMHVAVGVLFVLWTLRAFAVRKFDPDEVDKTLDRPLLVVFVTILTAIIGSHLHLSKPYFSFLALLNLRTSWLSREVVMTILFFFTTAWLLDLQFSRKSRKRLKTAVGWAATVFGFGAVYSMAEIYRLPTQVAWNTTLTVASFIFATVLLGIMALALLLIMDLIFVRLRHMDDTGVQAKILQQALPWFAICAGALVLIIVAENAYQLTALSKLENGTAQISLRLIWELYPALFLTRLVFIVLGVGLLGAAVTWQARLRKSVNELLIPTYIACLLVMVSEILGRFIFYAMHVRIGI